LAPSYNTNMATYINESDLFAFMDFSCKSIILSAISFTLPLVGGGGSHETRMLFISGYKSKFLFSLRV